jgi:hypothetical protein
VELQAQRNPCTWDTEEQMVRGNRSRNGPNGEHESSEHDIEKYQSYVHVKSSVMFVVFMTGVVLEVQTSSRRPQSSSQSLHTYVGIVP